MNRFNIDFGQLTQRIAIYNLTIARDAIGGEIVTKSLWAECWAKLEPQRQNQNLASHVRHNNHDLMVHTRYQIGLLKQMLIEHEGVQYEIKSVVNLEAADQWLKITATRNEVLI